MNIFFRGPKTQYDTLWLSADGFHNFWRKSIKKKRKPEQKIDAAFGTSFIITVSVFKEAGRNFILNILLNKTG